MKPDLARITVERLLATKNFSSIIEVLYPSQEIEKELLRRLSEDSIDDLLFQLESLPSSPPVKTSSGHKPRRKFDQKADPWEEFLATQLPRYRGETLTTSNILTDILNVPIERQKKIDQQRIGEIMRRLGYSQSRQWTSGHNLRVWRLTDQGQVLLTQDRTLTISKDNKKP